MISVYKIKKTYESHLVSFQDAASPKFTILVQLVPCANQKFDTCLKTVKIIMNNDRNNVSSDQFAKTAEITPITTTLPTS